MTPIAVVDSGTTSTRLRVWDGEAVRWEARLEAGARDTARDGHPQRIRSAVAELAANARTATGTALSKVVCSGMITSDLGLHAVTHLPAPATLDDLARGIVHAVYPDVSSEPVAFIPGVRTDPVAARIDALRRGDLLRGEEVEVAGLRELLRITRPSAFVHFGSHHKVVDVTPDGTITGSRTALTGELLAVLSEHTILRSSVREASAARLDRDAVLAGADDCLRDGFGRAAFLVRVGAQIAKLEPDMSTSYLIGALATLDLPLLPMSDDHDLILYGHGHFPTALGWLLERASRAYRYVDGATADRAAVLGAARILARREGGMA